MPEQQIWEVRLYFKILKSFPRAFLSSANVPVLLLHQPIVNRISTKLFISNDSSILDRLFRLTIFFSPVRGWRVVALTVDDNFFVPILMVDSY